MIFHKGVFQETSVIAMNHMRTLVCFSLMKGLIIWWDRVRRGSWSPTKPIVLINYKWVRINGQTTKLSTTNCPNNYNGSLALYDVCIFLFVFVSEETILSYIVILVDIFR